VRAAHGRAVGLMGLAGLALLRLPAPALRPPHHSDVRTGPGRRLATDNPMDAQNNPRDSLPLKIYFRERVIKAQGSNSYTKLQDKDELVGAGLVPARSDRQVAHQRACERDGQGRALPLH
jgi:hypothetical protein